MRATSMTPSANWFSQYPNSCSFLLYPYLPSHTDAVRILDECTVQLDDGRYTYAITLRDL